MRLSVEGQIVISCLRLDTPWSNTVSGSGMTGHITVFYGFRFHEGRELRGAGFGKGLQVHMQS